MPSPTTTRILLKQIRPPPTSVPQTRPSDRRHLRPYRQYMRPGEGARGARRAAARERGTAGGRRQSRGEERVLRREYKKRAGGGHEDDGDSGNNGDDGPGKQEKGTT